VRISVTSRSRSSALAQVELPGEPSQSVTSYSASPSGRRVTSPPKRGLAR
jgi:hypothetical protein